MRHDPRQEPYAVTLHVRICAGGGQQWPSLPRPFKELVPEYNPSVQILNKAFNGGRARVAVQSN